MNYKLNKYNNLIIFFLIFHTHAHAKTGKDVTIYKQLLFSRFLVQVYKCKSVSSF